MRRALWLWLAIGLLLEGAARAAEPMVTPSPEGGAGYERKLTIKLRDTPLREALQALFVVSGFQYVIVPNVPDLPFNLNIRDVGLAAAVRILVRQAAVAAPGLTTSRDGEITLVRIRSAVAPPEVASLPQPARDRKVSVTLREAAFRSAVDSLFRGTGVQYSIDAAVPNVPVSLFLKDVPLQQIFRLFLQQAAVGAPGLTSRREGDVILIRMAPVRQLPAEVAPDFGAVPEETPQRPWQRIALRYVDVAALTNALGGTMLAEGGAPGVANPHPPAPSENLSLGEGDIRVKPLPNRAIPTRKPRVSDDLPPRIDPRLLNPGGPGQPDEPALPGQLGLPAGVEAVVGVRSQNALLARGTDEGLRALRDLVRILDVPRREFLVRLSSGRLVAEGRVLNGATLSATHVTGAERLLASVTPRLNGDGSVDVRVEGVLRADGSEHPLQTRVRATPGKALTLFTLGEGPRARRLWLRVTELPEGAPR
jgi:type II secretory pathway component GspD/PulD (secretin)